MTRNWCGKRIAALGFLVVAGVSACSRTSRSDDPSRGSTAAASLQAEVRQVTLERRACYGSCPVYNVIARSDGNVRFEGIRNVAAMGVLTWRVAAESVATVFHYADSIKFASLPAKYDFGEPGCSPYIADLPGFAVTVETAGTPKRVYADGGCPNVPGALAVLPSLIDRVAKVESSVGKP